MKKLRRTSRSNTHRSRLEFDRLERRNLLANDVLPDIFAWESEERGYLHDYEIEGDLLRFTTAFGNQGDGHLEVYGGDVLANGNQEVLQRIYDDEGGFRDRVAGEFTYHPGHGHIHFDGYAIYNLREIGPGGEVGDIIATGGKISFCLIDITRYDPNAGSSNYGSCGTRQGVSAGWSDVYSRFLSNQWINISGVADGDYYLEVVTDPEDQLLESDETNNTTIITVTIEDGPGVQGDRFESNDSFATAYNMGMLSDRVEPGLSIHTDQDVDYFQFNAVDHGDFEIHVNFSHDLGNIDAFVYDEDFNLIASGDSTNDLEDLHFHTHPDQPYYLEIVGADGATNGYDLEFYGPGELLSDTTMSDDVPIAIPDSGGSRTPGPTVTSTLEGPDITLTDLNLIFEDLQHTYLGDLHIDLTSPAGTTATILRSTWESPSGPLGGEDDFVNTFLDDQATTSIDDGTAPFSGSFNVNYGDVSNPLSVFNGESALGTWTVSITDWFSADTGTLNAWGLNFTGIDNNPGDVWEQNDAFPQATDLGIIGTVGLADMSIHNQSDVDFFRFNAQDSTHVQLDLGFNVNDGNLDVIIYDSNQQEIARGDSINDDESLLIPVEEGELYYIEVFGFNGATNSYSFDIDVPLLLGETGELGLVDDQWTRYELANEYDDPVIMVTTPGLADPQGVTVEIAKVTPDSFYARLHNWDTNTSGNAGEGLQYFVIEAGTHTLRDGTTIKAGHHVTTDLFWRDVSFDESFSATPIVFAQMEHSSRDPFTMRLSNVDENGFSMLAQGREAQQFQSRKFHTHWIAIEAGAGANSNSLFDVGATGEKITHEPTQFPFAFEFDSVPGLILNAQTTNELDTAGVRVESVGTQGATIFIEEETSLDSEVQHAAENVGYFAFLANQNLYAMEPTAQGERGYVVSSTGKDADSKSVTSQRDFVRTRGFDWFLIDSTINDAELKSDDIESRTKSGASIQLLSRDVESMLTLVPQKARQIDRAEQFRTEASSTVDSKRKADVVVDDFFKKFDANLV